MRYLKINQIKRIIVYESLPIKNAFKILNETGLKIIFVIDKNQNLIGVVNDGDLRRFILKKNNLKKNIIHATNFNFFKVEKKKGFEKKAKNLIEKYQLTGVPILKKGVLVGLYTQKVSKKNLNNYKVVIMAGGKGERLAPLTITTPKALLKYKNKPLINYTIDNCKKHGFNSHIVSINYLGDKILNFFKKTDKKITFLKETKPLGTIGALKLIKNISTNFLVFNCDIITNLNIKNFFNYHLNQNSMMTVGVKKFDYKKPYGEIKIENNKVKEIYEKPIETININTGIYAFNKKIIPIIRKEKILDIIELINFLKKKKININTYFIKEKWCDVGQKEFITKLKK